jgi:hypothetical protein
MPKLDALQTAERLRRQLDKLMRNEEIAIRDLRALLTTQQNQAINTAWQEQQLLRKEKRARTEEEQRTLGWKTKREIQIDVVKQALYEYEENELTVLEKQLQNKELRQANIFMREFVAARNKGKDFWSAWNWANNELVRAGLPRIDGQVTQHLNERDKQVREMEAQILERIRSEMTEEEREQNDLLRDFTKSNKQQKNR